MTGGEGTRESVALRYLLQMATISLTRGSEVAVEDGKRMVVNIRDIATTVSILLSQKEGDYGGF